MTIMLLFQMDGRHQTVALAHMISPWTYQYCHTKLNDRKNYEIYIYIYIYDLMNVLFSLSAALFSLSENIYQPITCKNCGRISFNLKVIQTDISEQLIWLI